MENYLWNVWDKTSDFLPFVVNAIAVVIAGIFVGKWTKRLILLFLKRIRFDQIVKRIGWEDFFSQNYPTFSFPLIIAIIVEVFVNILFIMIASEIVKLTVLSQLLEKIVMYSPNVFVSCLIFIIIAYSADFSQKVVVGIKTLKEIRYSSIVGKIIDWTIKVLGILAILYQLQIVPQLILVIFIGAVLTIALALGIALGLAGKEPVSRFLHDLEQKFN